LNLQAKKGVLLIHGLTGTPSELRSLKKRLEENGFYCESPIVSGHLSSVFDLESKRWEDWYKPIEEDFINMTQKFSEVYIAGLSLGSLLAMHLAKKHAIKIDALALLSSPIVLKGLKIHFLPFIIHSPLNYLYRFEKKNETGILDGMARIKHKGYDEIPVKSVWELLKLKKMVLKELNEIKIPVLMCHSEKDETADIKGGYILFNKLGSDIKKFVRLKSSGHIITEDFEKDVVEKEIIDFFKSN